MMFDDDWYQSGIRSRHDKKTKFKTLLCMNAKDNALIVRVIDLLELLFKVSGTESYFWQSATFVSKDKIAEAARRLSGRPVAGVRILPVRALAFGGGSLIQENFQERLVSEVDKASLFYSEEDLLRIRFQSMNFPLGFMDTVKSQFGAVLWDPLLRVLASGMEITARAHGIVFAWPALLAMIHYYICCGILADKESRIDMLRYEQIIYLLGNGVVFWGEERGHTGVWYVLAG